MARAAKKTFNVVPIRRQWSAAKMTGLTADWPIFQRPIDGDIRSSLSAIRARARELAQNSDHAKGFLRIVRNNLVGKTGFVLQSRANQRNGKPDQRTRDTIESAWRDWSRRGVCELSGKFDWRSLQRHVAETVARDGEAFLRILRSEQANRWRFALQVIDPEAVDVQFNGEFQGRQVRMGIELDDMRRPVAYHLLGESPINTSSYRTGIDRYRVPASEMIHVYLPEFCWQTRGVPWLAVGAGRIHMIQGTEDAEVTASRASAAKFAAYEASEWAPPPGPDPSGLVGADGNPISSDQGRFAQDIAPGTMEVVPYGYQLKMLDPQHPNTAMGDFLKWGLRSVATGWGVSYNTLGNDAEGVNYTSLRFFLGVERDNWMELQDWFESDLIQPVFDQWLSGATMLGLLELRPGREAAAADVYWQPRRWDGPDPAKQAQADRLELENGSTTLTEILARKGRDFDDVIGERVRELARIKELAEQAGLALSDVMPYLAASAPKDDNTDDTETDDEQEQRP